MCVMALPKQKKIAKKTQQSMKFDHAHVILYPTLKHYNRLNYFFFYCGSNTSLSTELSYL